MSIKDQQILICVPINAVVMWIINLVNFCYHKESAFIQWYFLSFPKWEIVPIFSYLFL